MSPVKFRVIVFSSSEYVEYHFREPLSVFSTVTFVQARLDENSARLARDHDAAIIFVNDDANAKALKVLAECNVKTVALRCAGFDRVDLAAAKRLGIRVQRVPSYSPRSVAEHALSLLMAVARNLKTAQYKMLSGDYTLSGLVGVQVSHKTYGVIGTGNIGLEFIKLLKGFEGKILAYDLYPTDTARKLGAEYVTLEELLKRSDFISLHAPLTDGTRHLISAKTLGIVKRGAILINASRGGLMDTKAVLEALKEGKLGGVGSDVYEGEEALFFKDTSALAPEQRMKLWDRYFLEFKSMPNTVVTPHIAFLTVEALRAIAETTVSNLKDAHSKPEKAEGLCNQVLATK